MSSAYQAQKRHKSICVERRQEKSSSDEIHGKKSGMNYYPALIIFVWPNFHSFRYEKERKKFPIVGHKHIDRNFSCLLLFLFSHFFRIFLMRIFALKSRNLTRKTLSLIGHDGIANFRHVFRRDMTRYQWLYLNYSNCTPFFPRENDGKIHITIRLSRNPTRFWVKMFKFEKKIVKMSTFRLSFMFKSASENQYSIVYY